MNNLSLNVAGFFCQLIIDDSAFFEAVKKSKFWKVYAPDVVISEPSEHPNMIVEINPSIKTINFSKSIVKIPHTKNVTAEDIITTIDYIFEAHRNSKGIYTINSSTVVSTDSKAIIFFGGATGMGKTGLARFFSEEKHFSMYSDDKTLIDIPNLKVINGSNYIHLNKLNLKKEFELNDAEHIEFKRMSKKHSLQIALFVYGYSLDAASFSEEEVWDPKKFEWHLYEALTKRIRGTTRRIAGGSISLPSLDTKVLSEKRIKDVQYLCSEIHCLFIKAAPQKIFEVVSREVNNIETCKKDI